MLAQNSQGLDAAQYQQLLAGLADLIAIPAICRNRSCPSADPDGYSVQLLSAHVARCGQQVGQKVELVTQGEATELGQGPGGKITDPLVSFRVVTRRISR